MRVSFAETLRQFRSADDPASRNQLALDLGDSKRPEARTALIRALRDPATKGARGTIVYALLIGEFNCTGITHDLVGCVIDGSFEETDHALEILGRMDDIPHPANHRARVEYAMARLSHDDWRRDALEDCLRLLSPGEQPASR